MPNTNFEIVTLKSGLKSLRLRSNHETFHPVIGAAAEAEILYIRQQRLVERIESATNKFVIWDVGLGAAGNATAVLNTLQKLSPQVDIELHSFDRTVEPLEFALGHTEDLNYLHDYREVVEELLLKKCVQITPEISWHLHEGDFRDQMLQPGIPTPDSILYDPYSPTSNLEMWNLEHFAQLRKRIGEESVCLLTNYTRSTVVRVTWLLAGFFVGVGAGIGEKEETSIASNNLSALESPLGKKWLERVEISHSAAPLRGDFYGVMPISPEDFEVLKRHPQFLQS